MLHSYHPGSARTCPNPPTNDSRLLGSSSGFKVMSHKTWLAHELTLWSEQFNCQYVLLVEAMLSDGSVIIILPLPLPLLRPRVYKMPCPPPIFKQK